MNKNTLQDLELSTYNGKVNLVEVRSNPDKYPRFITTPKSEAIEHMTRYVLAACLYRAQEMHEDTLRFTATALVNEIISEDRYGMRALSWYEIGRAIRNAVLGDGREIRVVCVSSIYTALLDYVKNEGSVADSKAHELKAKER